MLHLTPSTIKHILRWGLLRTASSFTSASFCSTRCGSLSSGCDSLAKNGSRNLNKEESPSSPVTLDTPHVKPYWWLSERVAVPVGVATVRGAPQSSVAAEGRARVTFGAVVAAK